jgi:hypothetical protein
MDSVGSSGILLGGGSTQRATRFTAAERGWEGEPESVSELANWSIQRLAEKADLEGLHATTTTTTME